MMPVKEARRDHHESVKLLSQRMFRRSPAEVEESRIIRPPARKIVTVEEAVNQVNQGQPLPPPPERSESRIILTDR